MAELNAVSLKQAKSQVVLALKAGLVPMLWGSPAIGKSSLIHQIAKEFGLKVIDLRLSQCEPTDLLGFPSIVGGRSSYVPMDTFPLEGDEVPKGYRGWLLLLDELPSASRAVQAASYKLILDRMVGTHKLHSKVSIAAAGNLLTDNAIVEEMSTALQSRMVHYVIKINPKDWLEWAVEKGIDHRIVSYINYRPDMLYTFDPDHTDKTYGSPRTWEFIDRIGLANKGEISREILPTLGGAISFGLANEFLVFCDIYTNLVKVEEIIHAPDTARVPTQPNILFALTGMLSYHMSVENAEVLMKYIARLPIEFQIITLRQGILRDSGVKGLKPVQEWVATNASAMF